jgi:cell division inhibitor SepF
MCVRTAPEVERSLPSLGRAGSTRNGSPVAPSRPWSPRLTPSRPRATIGAVVGFSDVWNRTLVYFGIAEDEEWDEDGLVTNEELERDYRARDRHNVRRLPRRREVDDWTDSEADEAPSAPTRPARGRLRGVDSGSNQVKVHLVLPRSFNDAQQIADRFKDLVPVILNLQNADTELSKRLIDFSSGLTYALDGSMQRVADKVFLLTPRNVELSAEERARALDRGGFFNQA